MKIRISLFCSAILIILCISPNASYASGTFRLECKLHEYTVDGQPYYWHHPKYASISYMRNTGEGWMEFINDSIEIINNVFSYSGEAEGLTAVKIRCKEKTYPVVVYVEPGRTTSVTMYADKPCHFEQHGTSVDNEQRCFNNYIYERDSINNDILRYHNAVEELFRISNPQTSKEADWGLDMLKDDLYEKRRKSLLKRNKEVISFVEQHPNFKISPDLLCQVLEKGMCELDAVKNLSEKLKYFDADSTMMQLLKYRINEAELVRICKNAPTGAKAPDFTAVTTMGQTFRLKEMAGKKYVLLYSDYLDDSDTYMGHPYINVLKDIYSKYQSVGLEVVALSRDFESHIWKQLERQTDWTRIIDIRTDPNTFFETRYISGKYPLGILPGIILINKDGIIIAKWEWRDFEKDMKAFMENEFEREIGNKGILKTRKNI